VLESIQPFDLVLFLALFAMFVVGFAQGITRRLLGTAAILFSLFLGAQLRTPFGGYLGQQWTNISPDYSYMIGFGAVFVATAITLSVGIQIGYRPAPLLYRYPVLDEILGGVLGVLEGLVIFMAVLIIIDPYFFGAGLGPAGVVGEFGPLRSLHAFIDDSVVAGVLRENVIPALFAVLGGLFPEDVVKAFAAVLSAAR
jgi:uncharacterized membrane protein required for colicin V production